MRTDDKNDRRLLLRPSAARGARFAHSATVLFRGASMLKKNPADMPAKEACRKRKKAAARGYSCVNEKSVSRFQNFFTKALSRSPMKRSRPVRGMLESPHKFMLPTAQTS